MANAFAAFGLSLAWRCVAPHAAELYEIGDQLGAALERRTIGLERLPSGTYLGREPRFGIFAGPFNFAGPCAQTEAVYGNGAFQGQKQLRETTPLRLGGRS